MTLGTGPVATVGCRSEIFDDVKRSAGESRKQVLETVESQSIHVAGVVDHDLEVGVVVEHPCEQFMIGLGAGIDREVTRTSRRRWIDIETENRRAREVTAPHA